MTDWEPEDGRDVSCSAFRDHVLPVVRGCGRVACDACVIVPRPLVPVSSTPRGASTSGLSTTCSAWGLQRPKAHGTLILEQASRLDAFSGYPFRT